MKYEFRYIIKMTNGKKYEIITNFHGEKDVLKYIDSHDYIELFDRKIEEIVAVKSEYVMSALYKDSKKIDSEGNAEWSDRIEYLKEENEKLNEELKMSKERINKTLDRKLRIEKEKSELQETINKQDYTIATLFDERENLKQELHSIYKGNEYLLNVIKMSDSIAIHSDVYDELEKGERD